MVEMHQILKETLMDLHPATQLSPKTNHDAEFAYGAGQIDPSKAINPGLVYDANEIDYVRFSCGQGYSTRTVTNVGLSSSTYKAIVTAPQGLKIEVNPNVLYVGKKQTFLLTIEGTLEENIVSDSLVWDDDKFQFRSPIVVFNAP
ncbi:unnamed protein product [Lupinus luteus]|uniref:Subtilisin-like protease fibronectin type-III domain-containing protein n=1 Tax=Lupinus luteus TaxID=3873 RepID=A0AAV1VWT4_LUPLU